mmetsp:Transcript_19769/g.57508  ORF Transcript_19769/g.57508 Transcript_19769/m.57508 type:complete len:89 (+) Transcript_19769:1348-1614(+)
MCMLSLVSAWRWQGLRGMPEEQRLVTGGTSLLSVQAAARQLNLHRRVPPPPRPVHHGEFRSVSLIRSCIRRQSTWEMSFPIAGAWGCM